MEYNKLLMLITAIFSLIILSICIAILIKKKYNLLTENIVTYIFYLTFLFTQYKLKIQVSPFIIMLTLITIIGNNLIGDYLNFYKSSKHFDRFLHAFGSFSFSLFYYSILDKAAIHITSPKYYVAIFIATIGISSGCIYEIFEFILDSMTNSKNQHGLTDTNFDLISDVIGAITAGIAYISIF
ncbi:hypothetical protein [Clostridium sp.]|uniref:hypothetical protein n=1 Tax=Clostridium sp. TaxID=1506 RepID=UPI00284AA2EB|nr:hypothetical protein [Clostridium sp.]MDR3594548.1 hypothetical protein [Clostridium sp.]